MDKRTVFSGKLLPYALLAPQLLVTLVFFYWPAGQAVYQSFLLQDAFGISTQFVWLENYRQLCSDPALLPSHLIMAGGVRDRRHRLGARFPRCCSPCRARPRARRRRRLQDSTMIWPCLVAPVVAGVLWLFMLQPSLGMLSQGIRILGYDWNPYLHPGDALALVIVSATWKQISYNFLIFLAGLQSIPRSLIEAAAIDGAKGARRFWTIMFPAAVADDLLSADRQPGLCLLRHLRHHPLAVTKGGPGGRDDDARLQGVQRRPGGRRPRQLGSAVGDPDADRHRALTAIQFRYIERKVNY